MKSSNKTFIALLLFSITACGSDKIGYVDLNKLYEGFSYKKNLTEEFNKVKSARQRILDSVEIELNQMAGTIEQGNKFNAFTEKEFEERKNKYFQLAKQFEEDNQALSESYNSKVILQLNTYLKEFGKKNKFKILLGADNKGSILYGDESLDQTENALKYVNESFEGGKNIK